MFHGQESWNPFSICWSPMVSSSAHMLSRVVQTLYLVHQYGAALLDLNYGALSVTHRRPIISGCVEAPAQISYQHEEGWNSNHASKKGLLQYPHVSARSRFRFRCRSRSGGNTDRTRCIANVGGWYPEWVVATRNKIQLRARTKIKKKVAYE